MNKRTLKALHGSIRKWIAIVEWRGADNGPSNCPLCVEFFDWNCEGCPVSEKTGRGGCDGSPYEKWMELQCKLEDCEWVYWDDPQIIVDPDTQRAAEAEALFLISLLPEEEQRRYFK